MILMIFCLQVFIGTVLGLNGTTAKPPGWNSTGVDAVRSHHNITLLLDGILNGYDKNLRPNFGGPPIVVEIDFNVRSMGPISEIDMTFSMDCYFRQTWLDRRLSFRGGGAIDTMTLGISTLEKIWKPDTYFFNGKDSHLHTITVPNRFVRINQDGRVLYSQRLTVKASCPMNLENFPMDTQWCPLELGSFGYSAEDVLYRWNSQRRVVIAPDMKMSQFDLISTPSKNDTTILRDNEYSTLAVRFSLQRHTGYFIIQVYAPCILLVVLSWVAFWINREATADRVALGVTTILTMTFLSLDSRSDLPKMSYSTALDFFMYISFAFVFATIIQFALVHYFTKRGSGEVFILSTESSADESDCELIARDSEDADKVATVAQESNSDCCDPIGRHRQHYTTEYERAFRVRAANSNHVGRDGDASARSGGTMWRLLQRMRGCRVTHYGGADDVTADATSAPSRPYVVRRRNHQGATSSSETTRDRHGAVDFNDDDINSVSRIDSIARVLFPVSFFLINVFYWYIYLAQSDPGTLDA